MTYSPFDKLVIVSKLHVQPSYVHEYHRVPGYQKLIWRCGVHLYINLAPKELTTCDKTCTRVSWSPRKENFPKLFFDNGIEFNNNLF